jgi:oxaloacetate decarboxylase beta subunit
MEKLYELWMTTGFPQLQWQMVVMWAVVAVLLYLAIVKGFEPLLLVPISLGALIANLPIHEFILQHPHGGEPGGLFYYLDQGIKLQIYPPLIFLGVGALVDFGPLIANPRTLLLGGAAQFGIFGTFLVAPLLGFDLSQSAAIGVIGGADGPTSIFTASKLAPDLLGPIAVAAYSYMALVPLIQPPIMKLLTTDAERRIKMKTLRKVSQLEKLVFAAVVMAFCCTIVRDAAPLISMLFIGNLLRESKVTERLTKAAQNEIINIVTIFLGLCVGLKMGMGDGGQHLFLNPKTLGILVLGVIAFGAATASGVLMAKIMNLFSKNKINPLIGSAGVSAVPMAARVSQDVGQKYDPTNYLLMHAMGPNVAGVIGSALAAGYFIAMFK